MSDIDKAVDALGNLQRHEAMRAIRRSIKDRMSLASTDSDAKGINIDTCCLRLALEIHNCDLGKVMVALAAVSEHVDWLRRLEA